MVEKPTASISSISFSGGQTVSFNPNDKILLVGPNNSGKSQSLREVWSVAQSGNTSNLKVLTDLKFAKTGTSQDLAAFLEENADYDQGIFGYKSWRIHKHILGRWNRPYLTNGLANGFIKSIDANGRLQICVMQQSIGPSEHKTKPQHLLYDDTALMERVSRLFYEAFSAHLMIDFRGGKHIPIHVGKMPPKELQDRVGNDYVAAVRYNPALHEQGDGIKSYAGILFESMVEDFDITLLDEPEAFLHPPQMRRLGETLASEVDGQLIVAAHSSDIMRGFLEGTRGEVRVLRIRREGELNFVEEAAPDVIKELWSQPVLRYSNALEGVFHEETIICEDDSDCRLFQAIGDYLAANDDQRWKDTAYVPTGGKHGIPRVAEILRKVGVPVKAVFDMDFLAEKDLVKRTVQAFGGDWTEIEPLWSRVDAAVRAGVKPKTIEEIKTELIALIRRCEGDTLPRSELNDAMRQDSIWNVVKRFGVAGIPSGDAHRQYVRLAASLEAIGVYIVPVGEVESFCREVGRHGPKFVNKLLSDMSLDDQKLDDLRDFVARVHKGVHAPLGASPPIDAA